METTRLIELLGQTEADDWEITEVRTEGWEFYFIRHALDQNRLVRTTHCTVRVFRRDADGKYIGSASEEIPPTATDEEALMILHALSGRAGFVRNPSYELLARSGEDAQGEAGHGSGLPDVSEIAGDFIRTMQGIPESAEADINSYEIFANIQTVHFVNSRGVDRVESYPDSTLEVVLNARNSEQEIELYRILKMGSCDREGLEKELRDALRFGRDRLLARPMPKLVKLPVLFSTSAAKELCRFFTDRMNASYKVQGYSDWEAGVPLFGGEMDSKVTVEALRFLPNSSCNRHFDAEGALRRDEVLIRDGVPVRFLGDRQFSAYLGMEDSFIPGNYRVCGGTYSEEALRAGDYLEAVEFSDLQSDPLSGNLAGELRLAYWHHGGETIPVTGGSISASLLEAGRTMKLSKQLRQYDNMEIPALIRLEGVSVTGITEV